MLSKDHIIFDSNNIIHIIFVMVIQILQNSELYSGLILKLFLIADDFDGDLLVCLMVKALNGLAKATLTKEL